MLIRQSQIVTLGAEPKEKFILKTIDFLRTHCTKWSAGKTDEELRSLIVSTIDIAETLNIRKEKSIQKLLYYTADRNLLWPFSDKVIAILDQDDTSEDEKLKQLNRSTQIEGVR